MIWIGGTGIKGLRGLATFSKLQPGALNGQEKDESGPPGGALLLYCRDDALLSGLLGMSRSVECIFLSSFIL